MDLMAVSGEGQSKEYEVHLMIPVGQMLSQQVNKDGHAIMHLTSISDKIFYAQAACTFLLMECMADAKASFQDEMHAAKGVLEKRTCLKRNGDKDHQAFCSGPKTDSEGRHCEQPSLQCVGCLVGERKVYLNCTLSSKNTI